MFDHVGVNVRDFEASRAFYRRALEPLGLQETVAWSFVHAPDGNNVEAVYKD